MKTTIITHENKKFVLAEIPQNFVNASISKSGKSINFNVNGAEKTIPKNFKLPEPVQAFHPDEVKGPENVFHQRIGDDTVPVVKFRIH